MATIIKNYTIVGEAEHKESDDFAINYWGSLEKEKIFVLPLWEAQKMLNAGSSNQIALRIKNIDSPENISARWIILEEMHADILQDPVEYGIHYYVLNDSVIEGPYITNTKVRRGMIHLTTSPHRNVIWGRIGKSTTGKYHVFFLVAECKIIDPGAGGSGPLCGAKIPPKDD